MPVTTAPSSSSSSPPPPPPLTSFIAGLPTAVGRLNLRIVLLQCLFLATGMMSTLGAQWLKYRGAADSLSFLTVLCTYLGMVLVALLPNPSSLPPSADTSSSSTSSSSSSSVSPSLPPSSALSLSSLLKSLKDRLDSFGAVAHRSVMIVAGIDVSSQLILVAGLFLTGSGLYMVVYSSVIVFTALGNWLFLKKSISPWQWAAVVLISVGLSLTAIGRPRDSADSARVALGVGVSLLGSWLHSLVYTLNDHHLTTSSSASPAAQPTPPRAQCVWMGLYATAFTLLSMLLLSLPTLAHLAPHLLDPLNAAAYVALVLASLGHSLAWFELVGRTGAVATGVLQALRAVAVFGVSHVWFCDVDDTQCFNVPKGVATLVVVAGVIGFAVADGGGHAPQGRLSKGSQYFSRGRAAAATGEYESVAAEEDEEMLASFEVEWGAGRRRAAARDDVPLSVMGEGGSGR
ncbi:hypothetical protein DFJ73DRAFT_964313 [Zopfochytrium polystomum]|nr:hypothetical protein DFJ73DRAFT_964313 [Zopfochytrium polystomum]